MQCQRVHTCVLYSEFMLIRWIFSSKKPLKDQIAMKRIQRAQSALILIIAIISSNSAIAQRENDKGGSVVEFRIAQDKQIDGHDQAKLPGGDQLIYLDPESQMGSKEIDRAVIISDTDGNPAISVKFTEAGSQDLARITSENIGKRFAITLDGNVIAAPIIRGTIASKAIINGDFTIQDAVKITHSMNNTSRFSAAKDPTIPLESFTPLFNGKDLSGWANVNTEPDTWQVKEGVLVCSGLPIGVMRSEKQYENFILHIEWRHMKPGGNSGVFVWSEGSVPDGRRLPKGMEVQMLELDWVNKHPRGKRPNHVGYVSGELFGAGGLNATPDIPRGRRSMSRELRCNGYGQWNTYDVVCVDGTVKLSINGKFVNSIRDSETRRGYLCLESEGSEIHFRDIRIMELPPGETTLSQRATLLD